MKTRDRSHLRQHRERRTPPYHALALWQRRDGDKPISRWIYDDLWRAAMAEAERGTARRDSQRGASHMIPDEAYVDAPVEWDKEEVWPELIPLDAAPDLPEFPSRCLPEPFAQYVEELAVSLQTPLALPGCLSLTMIATAVHGHYRLLVRPDWLEPLNIWAAVVLGPGHKKSQVFGKVAVPIHERERVLGERERDAIAKRREERNLLEERLNKTRKTAAATKDATERGVLEEDVAKLAVDLEHTPKLYPPRLVVDDVTPERLASILAEQHGRIGLLSPEANVFAVMAGRYTTRGEANLEVYLKGHAGDDLTVDRQGGRHDHVPNPKLTLGLAVQPEVIQGVARNREFRGRGLVGRFLFAIPPSNLGTRKIAPPPMGTNTQQAYEAQLRALLDLTPGKDSNGDTAPHTLRLHPAALEAFQGFMREVEDMLDPVGELGNMTDWGGKIAGATARMAGLLHIAEQVERAHQLPIAAETVERAIGLGKYFIEHAKAVYGEMGADPDIENARRLVRWFIRSDRKDFSKRDAHQQHRSLFEHADDADTALDVLTEHGYIRPQIIEAPEKKRGRPPSLRYEINPAVLAEKTQKPKKSSIVPTVGNSECSEVFESKGSEPQATQGEATHEQPEEPVPDSMPWEVIEQAQEYALGHPGADQQSIVAFLGLAVSEATAGRAIDYLVATGDERFAHLAGQAR